MKLFERRDGQASVTLEGVKVHPRIVQRLADFTDEEIAALVNNETRDHELIARSVPATGAGLDTDEQRMLHGRARGKKDDLMNALVSNFPLDMAEAENMVAQLFEERLRGSTMALEQPESDAV